MLSVLFAVALLGLAAQPVPNDVRRMFEPSTAEFRDDLGRSWIEINLDASAPEFGTFGVYVFPSTFDLAHGYFGVVTPRAEPDGSYRLDQQVDVLIRRPTDAITLPGQDMPTTTEAGTVQLFGTLDMNRHAASLRLQVDGREVLLESSEPDVATAAAAANASVLAYVGEDWSTLYDLYTEGLHRQMSRAEFEQQMQEMTPPGPPIQVVSADVTGATLRTLAGFVHYTQIGRTELLQPSGRITPANMLVDVVWESGRWRLFHINIQRVPQDDPVPAA